MVQPVEDDMGTETPPELSPAYWMYPQVSGREQQQQQQQIVLEDEQALFAHTVRAHRQHASSRKSAGFRVSIAALESLHVDDLPEGERMCPICYNDYGVEGPEGINEAPLRIPRCKHVFGDHCIKKWLTQKHSCPYCRDTITGHNVGERSNEGGGSESAEGHDNSPRLVQPLSETMLMLGREAGHSTEYESLHWARHLRI